jgi:hypothetical protein
MKRKHLWQGLSLGAALALAAGGPAFAQNRDDNAAGARASSNDDSRNRAESASTSDQTQSDQVQSGQTQSGQVQRDQAQRDQPQRNQANRQNDAAEQNDSDAQHHAALGVSLGESDGRLRVIAVLPGSPAANAGIRAGDEITSAAGQRVRSVQDLVEEINERQPGAQVELGIRRNGERQTLRAQLVSRGSLRRTSNNRSDENRSGSATAESSNRDARQAWSNRGRSASYDEDQMASEPQRDNLSRQVRILQRQVSQLQEEIDELRTARTNRYTSGFRGNESRTTWQGDATSQNGRQQNDNRGTGGTSRNSAGRDNGADSSDSSR